MDRRALPLDRAAATLGATMPTLHTAFLTSERMPHMVRDFDDNKFPLAYPISFCTYGYCFGCDVGSLNNDSSTTALRFISVNVLIQLSYVSIAE